MEQHAKVLLAKITDSPAQTARDLEAKARMVPFILLSTTAVSRSLHGDEVDFFEVASEVKQFLQALSELLTTWAHAVYRGASLPVLWRR
jgi:hypothetical protein